MREILKLTRILSSIWHHPFNKGQRLKAILRFFKWQLLASLTGWDVIYPVTANTVMVARKGMTGMTGSIYCGLVEFEDMMFLLHALREKDLFADVGANVGIYSILASGEVGAHSVSIEPVKRTFDILRSNVSLNDIGSRVRLCNMGVGDRQEELTFTSDEDPGNHVVSETELDSSSPKERVRIDTLDNIFQDATPLIMKMDVEGFETKAIAGARRILADDGLKGIIIELNGSGARYGFDDARIHDTLLQHGFKCHAYEPYSRTFHPMDIYGKHNTIYLRDLGFFEARVRSARRITILDKSI